MIWCINGETRKKNSHRVYFSMDSIAQHDVERNFESLIFYFKNISWKVGLRLFSVLYKRWNTKWKILNTDSGFAFFFSFTIDKKIWWQKSAFTLIMKTAFIILWDNGIHNWRVFVRIQTRVENFLKIGYNLENIQV